MRWCLYSSSTAEGIMRLLQLAVIFLLLCFEASQARKKPIGRFYKGENADPEIVKARVGKPLTIECPPHGYTYNEVYLWGRFATGRRVNPFLSGSHDDRLILDGRNGTLVFPYLHNEDVIKIARMGGIQCRIYVYGAGRFLTSHRLLLKATGTAYTGYAAPTFYTHPPTTVLEQSDDTVVLRCIAFGKPTPTIKWFKDSKQIVKGGNYQLKLSYSSRVLVIDMRSSKSNNGLYTCEATNMNGKKKNVITSKVTLEHRVINGSWSEWSGWTNCVKKCGSGETMSRSRTCTNPSPYNGGATCSKSGVTPQVQAGICCKANGNWSEWSNRSKCTVTCGAGTQTRVRTCTNPAPKYGGANCSVDSNGFGNEQVLTCQKPSCTINGSWSEWSDWSTCTVTCEGGTQTRVRTCTNPAPQNGGANCTVDSNGFANEQVLTCQNRSCTPINGRWSEWSAWTNCSSKCGEREARSRSRSCTNPPPYNGGANCSLSGTNTESEKMFCPCKDARPWSSWTSCSATCGHGIKTRSRACIVPIRPNKGTPIAGSNGTQTKIDERNSTKIPENNNTRLVAGSNVTRIQNNGTQMKAYSENHKPQRVKKQCEELMSSSDNIETERAKCTFDPCTVVCSTNCHVDGWKPWSQWSNCSAACGNGVRRRSRTCGRPIHSAKGCSLPIEEGSEYCTVKKCHGKVNNTAVTEDHKTEPEIEEVEFPIGAVVVPVIFLVLGIISLVIWLKYKKRPSPTIDYANLESSAISETAVLQKSFVSPTLGQVVSKAAYTKKRPAPPPPVRTVSAAEKRDIAQIESGSDAILQKSFMSPNIGDEGAQPRRSIQEPEAHYATQRVIGAPSGSDQGLIPEAPPAPPAPAPPPPPPPPVKPVKSTKSRLIRVKTQQIIKLPVQKAKKMLTYLWD